MLGEPGSLTFEECASVGERESVLVENIFVLEGELLASVHIAFDGEYQMVEKKMFLYAVIAIAVGIGAILPLEFMMFAQAQAQANAENAVLTDVKPWFDAGVTYAHVELDVASVNSTMSLSGAKIDALVNFTLTPDVLETADAQIEFYRFAVSSDQGHIVDMGYYVLQSKGAELITFVSGDGTIGFANGLTYKGPSCNGGQGINAEAWNRGFTVGLVSDYIFGTSAGDVPEDVTDMRNAEVLYIEVSKVCTVTVEGTVTVTTPASGEVLQRVELAKTIDGFTYGSFTSGILPLPGYAIEEPEPGVSADLLPQP